ncbi:MAG: neprosin family prolyl endopeptidase [Frankiaceae bacterium]|nr:neprosin family prolyl endopeptidase [Frankiaceae bacterium]MBV9869982.1 neprosin family prolyl endopeptidase [Frankiaceae bacterium]
MTRRFAGLLTGLLVFGWLAMPAASANRAGPVVKGTPPIGAESAGQTTAQSGTTTYHYVYDRSLATASGAAAEFVVADPAVPAPDLHSLAELSVESADGRQIVEVGWTVDPGQFGDTLPHLFVYHWVDGQPSCYNACGFVPSGLDPAPGAPLTPGTVHTFKVNHAGGRWQVINNGIRVGYFPDTLWSTTPFTSIGLTQWFGEVAATASPPCAQMGNGLLAADPSAAAIRHLRLFNGPTVDTAPVQTDPSYYTGKRTAPNGMRFGGPGGCGPQPQMIEFESSPPGDATVGGAPYTVVASGGGSGNPVVFKIADNAESVCTIAVDSVSFIGPGRCEIDASQAGNPAFTDAAPARQIVHVRIPQTITFLSAPPHRPHVGGHRYKVVVSGGQSGKPVKLSVGHRARSACALHHTRRIDFIDKGTCTIRASQAGSATYAPADRVRQRFVVHRR